MIFKIVSIIPLILLGVTCQRTAFSWGRDWDDRDRERHASEYCSVELDVLMKTATDNGGTLTNLEGPVDRVVIGPNQRVEFMEAHIQRHHVGTGTRVPKEMEEKIKEMGQRGDIAGQLLSPHLGGPGDQHWNIFPQSPHNSYRDSWAKAEEKVANLAMMGNTVKYLVLLEYPNGGSTRPDSIWYAYAYNDKSGNHCASGTISSPGRRIKWGFDFYK